MSNNYTLGRGELHFAQFLSGTQTPGGERYLGNTPEWNATIESENLDHYNSDRGIREKDASIVLEVNRTASFITDNIDPANIALFFFGSKTALAVTGYSVTGEEVGPIMAGHSYQLGISAQNPSGAKGLDPDSLVIDGSSAVMATGTITFGDNPTASDTVTIGNQAYTFVAAVGGAGDVLIGADADASAANLAAAINGDAGEGVTYGTGTLPNTAATASVATNVVTVTAKIGGEAGNDVALATTGGDITVSGATLSGGTGTSIIPGIDFVFDPTLGRITIPEGSSLTDGSTLTVDYEVLTSTRERIISGSAPVEGALRYISYNPAGKQFDWYMPYVKLSPNGDYALKGDEWQQIPFNVEILRKGALEAIYVEGRPLTA